MTVATMALRFCLRHPLIKPFPAYHVSSIPARRPIHVRWRHELVQNKQERGAVASGQPLSKSNSAQSPLSWVDRLPPTIRPYLYLTRIDKPIGTLLLFYPCGAQTRHSRTRPMALKDAFLT